MGFIIHFLVSAGIASAAYLFGHILALAGGNEDRGGRFAYVFRRLSLGMTAIVTLYAVINCAGATVLAGVLPLMLFGAKFSRFRWKNPQLSVEAAALFTLVAAAVAALNFFAGHDLAGNIYSLHIDHSFYTALANYIADNGIESGNIELMFPDLQSPTIYHWFDIHMAALAGNLTGNYFNARIFVTLPLTAAAAVTGIASIIEKYCGQGKKAPWLALLVFFLPVLLVSFNSGKYEFGEFAFHEILSEKIYIMVCVVAWTVISENKILPLVIGGLLVSSAAPALFSGAFIILIAGFGANRRSMDYWKNVAALTLGGLWCVALYTLGTKENPLFIHALSIPEQISRAFTGSNLPQALKGAEVFAARIILNLLPCLGIFALLPKDNRKSVASIVGKNKVLLLAVVAGFFFACPLWFMRDAMQLAIEVSVPIAFVGQTVLLALLLTGAGKWRKIAAATLLAAGIATIALPGNTSFRGGLLDAEFTRKVAAAEGPIVWVDTFKRREEGTEYARDANYIVPFSVVRRLRNDYFPIRLDVYDIVYDPDDMRDYAVLASIENSTFYRWVESRDIPMKELRNAQTRFIKENRIHYVITPSDDMWIYGRGFKIEERTHLQSRGYTLFRISYDDNTIQ